MNMKRDVQRALFLIVLFLLLVFLLLVVDVQPIGPEGASVGQGMRKTNVLLTLFLVCTSLIQATSLMIPQSKVNAFDPLAMHPYSESLDTVGTLFEVASVLAPALLLAESTSEYMTIGVMYAETMLAAYGLKELGKMYVPRPRSLPPAIPIPAGRYRWL